MLLYFVKTRGWSGRRRLTPAGQPVRRAPATIQLASAAALTLIIISIAPLSFRLVSVADELPSSLFVSRIIIVCPIIYYEWIMIKSEWDYALAVVCAILVDKRDQLVAQPHLNVRRPACHERMSEQVDDHRSLLKVPHHTSSHQKTNKHQSFLFLFSYSNKVQPAKSLT